MTPVSTGRIPYRDSFMHSEFTPARRPDPARALHLIDPSDNVAVALRQLEPGEIFGSLPNAAHMGDAGDSRHELLVVRELIPTGHKVALRAIAAGNAVLKYGWPIGRARRDIEPGSLVHSENLSTQL